MNGTVFGLYLGDFESHLVEHGYRPSTVRLYLSKCRTFGSYLEQRGVELTSLGSEVIDEFLAVRLPQRRNCDEHNVRRQWYDPLHLLFDYLCRRHLVPAAPACEPQQPKLLTDYLTFLRDHRGVCEGTIDNHGRELGGFLDRLGVIDETELAKKVVMERVDAVLVDVSRSMGRRRINGVCGAVRSFLRYLHLCGLLHADLSEQVTRPRSYSLATLPRAMDWTDVERVLALPDVSTSAGRRDYAILALLAHCGLRAGEVAGLCLRDLDWNHDIIHLYRSKGNAIDRIPLVPVVGEALVGYLRCRPTTTHPQVFLRTVAPVMPVTSGCITLMTRKYLLQAGVRVPHLGAHTLRHSCAVRLLRSGFPLKTIGDVLGHEDPRSTFIYTKVAVNDLRTVALDVTGVLR